MQHFEVHQQSSAAILRLVDDRLFDTRVVSELHDELTEFVEAKRPARVVVSFECVVQCSTSIINGLILIKKRLADTGGRLKLCCMTEPIRDAYRVLNLEGTVFDIHDTTDAAIEAFEV